MSKILILEDSLTQAIQLQHLLQGAGYEVRRAANGVPALAILRDGWLPDAIISDIVMPEMDGYVFTSELKNKQDWAHIPVILLTSLNDPVDVIKGLECGADNFFTKPYSPDFLLSRIRYVLMNAELRSQRSASMGLEIFFAGERYRINSERVQILDLLFSSFENAIEKNKELERTIRQLQDTQQQLQTAKEAAEKANRAKSEFLGIAAHDIRNPIAAIRSLSELLEDSCTDQQADSDALDMLRMIKASSDSLLLLLDDLLNTSRIDAIRTGELTYERQEADLVQILRSVIEINTPRARTKKINLQVSSPESLRIAADPKRMREAFDNLVSNAVKYSPPNSQVMVSLALGSGEQPVIFKVKDDGPGLSREDQSQLFQRFRKLTPQPTAGEGSTGLGLSIVKSIVDLHEGTVFCESELGRGSTFTITLPYHAV